MKILHLIDSNGIYGAEQILLLLMQRQREAGLNPILGSIGRRGEQEKELEAAARNSGFTVYTLRMRSGINLAGTFRILCLSQKLNIDILHSHGYKSNILLGLIPKYIRKIPLLCTLHGWTGTNNHSKIALYTWIECRLIKNHDAVVTVSSAQLEDRRLLSAEIEKLKLHQIHNGIDVNNSNNALGFNGEVIKKFIFGKKGIVAIGRLSTEKNFSMLIDAMSILSNVEKDTRLVIIGEGQLRNSIQRKISDRNLESRIFLAGYRNDTRALMPLFKALVISSLTEGLPLTMLEAMASGLPVISTKVGGIPEVIRDGVTGILVPSGDPISLSSAIRRLTSDDVLSDNIRKEARTFVMNNFTSRIMADKYFKLYKNLTGKCTTTIINPEV